MAKLIKIAAVQINPELMNLKGNLENVLDSIKKAADNQAKSKT